MQAAHTDWEYLEAAIKLKDLDPEAIVGIVDHFTAGGSGRALARWVAGKTRIKGKLVAPAKYYAPITICRDGHVIQQAPLLRRCNHAAGLNRGLIPTAPDKAEINDICLGIEHSNYGWLIRDGVNFYVPKKSSGKWVKGKKYPTKYGTPVRAPDHKGVERFWEPYSEELIESSIQVHRAFVDLFPAIEREHVIRHSDISPDRKTDPGPLFPMARILDEVFDDGDQEEIDDFLDRRFYDPDAEMCVMPD